MQEAGGLADRLIAPAGRAYALVPGDARSSNTVDGPGRHVGAARLLVWPGSIGVLADVVRLSGAVGRA